MGITIDPMVDRYLVKGVEHQGDKYDVVIWKMEELLPKRLEQHLNIQNDIGFYVGFPLFVETVRQLYREQGNQARAARDLISGYYKQFGCLMHNTQQVIIKEGNMHLLDRIRHNSQTPLEYEMNGNTYSSKVADPNTYRYMGY